MIKHPEQNQAKVEAGQKKIGLKDIKEVVFSEAENEDKTAGADKDKPVKKYKTRDGYKNGKYSILTFIFHISYSFLIRI